MCGAVALQQKKGKGPKATANARRQPACWQSTEGGLLCPFFLWRTHPPNGRTATLQQLCRLPWQRTPARVGGGAIDGRAAPCCRRSAPKTKCVHADVDTTLPQRTKNVQKPKKANMKIKMICQGNKKKRKNDSFADPLFPIFLYRQPFLVGRCRRRGIHPATSPSGERRPMSARGDATHLPWCHVPETTMRPARSVSRPRPSGPFGPHDPR